MRWAHSVRPPCSSFSIRQTSGGCYIAAATLVFAQVFLEEARQNAELRAFVRLLMSNETAGSEHCPKVPSSVLRYYAGLLASGDAPLVTAKDVPAVQSAGVDLSDGGSAAEFLVAMLFDSNIDTVFRRHSLMPPYDAAKLVESMAANGSSGDRSVWWRRRRDELKPVLRDGPFANVTVYNVALLGGLGAPDVGAAGFAQEADREGLYNLIATSDDELVKSGRRLVAVILYLSRSSDNAAHAVALLPCRRGAATRWTLCNSWGSDCSSYEQGVADLAEADIDQARGIALVSR